ncbi:MAG TPA: Lpg1974 family pore-forming outer membrane protein, partial [Rhabdochlamydiaceae bacterium]
MPKLAAALCTLGCLYALGPDTLHAVELPKTQVEPMLVAMQENLQPATKITGLVMESLSSLPSEDTLDPFFGVWVDPGLRLPSGKSAIANTLKKYLGSPLDETNLQKLRAEVSQYYQNLKKETVSIQIDPEDVSDGVVHILISDAGVMEPVTVQEQRAPKQRPDQPEFIRLNESMSSNPAQYMLTGSSCEPTECDEDACMEGSLEQQMEMSDLSSKDKFALLAEKTDCLAETLGEFNCRDLHVNSCVQDYMMGAENGFFLTADFLYWQADEDDLEYAVYTQGLTQPATTPLSNISDKVPDLNFEWNPGFRVGIGGSSCGCDHWGIQLGYTYIYNKAHGSINVGPLASPGSNFLASTWDQILLGIFASEASAHWGVNYSTEVLEAYRNFFLGKNLIVKPRMGLLNANIKQNYHAYYTPDFSGLGISIPVSTMHAKCNYWGLGVRGGADLFWHFTKNFGLYGEFSAGLVYGKYNV